MPRFAAWGGAAGLAVGLLPFAIGSPTSAVPLWVLGGTVVGSITLLSAASAAGSLAIARRAKERGRLGSGEPSS